MDTILLTVILIGIVTSASSNPCIAPNATEECSSHGICVEGICLCEHRNNMQETYTGVYCECDNFSCARSNSGEFCSGHGICLCGVCVCGSGRSGLACECPVDPILAISACETPGTEVISTNICSEHGKCVCGKCRCDTTYFGRFCENNFLYTGEIGDFTTNNNTFESGADEKLFF